MKFFVSFVFPFVIFVLKTLSRSSESIVEAQ
jgi:hypothetical protein